MITGPEYAWSYIGTDSKLTAWQYKNTFNFRLSYNGEEDSIITVTSDSALEDPTSVVNYLGSRWINLGYGFDPPTFVGVMEALFRLYSGKVCYIDRQMLSFPYEPSLSEVAKSLPGVLIEGMKCPAPQDSLKNYCKPYTYSLYDCIIHLNDSHKWSRDQIADWLETLDIDITFKVKEGSK